MKRVILHCLLLGFILLLISSPAYGEGSKQDLVVKIEQLTNSPKVLIGKEIRVLGVLQTNDSKDLLLKSSEGNQVKGIDISLQEPFNQEGIHQLVGRQVMAVGIVKRAGDSVRISDCTLFLIPTPREDLVYLLKELIYINRKYHCEGELKNNPDEDGILYSIGYTESLASDPNESEMYFSIVRDLLLFIESHYRKQESDLISDALELYKEEQLNNPFRREDSSASERGQKHEAGAVNK